MKKIKQLLAIAAVVTLCAALSLAQEAEDEEEGQTGQGVENMVIIKIRDVRPRLQPGGELETDTRDGEIEQDFSPEEEKRKKRFNFTFEEKTNYDTNPTVVSDGEEEDYVNVINFSAGVSLFKRGIHEIGGVYSFYGENYHDTEDQDLQGHIFDIYYSYIADPLVFRLDYMYNHFKLDDKDYLLKHTVAPMLFYNSGAMAMEMLRIAVSVNEYPETSDLDGEDWSVQIRHFRFFDRRRKKRLSVSYKYSSSESDDGDQDYESHKFGVDIKFPLIWKMDLKAGLFRTFKEYGSGREDEKGEYDLEISRPINEIWKVSIGNEGVDNDSNDSESEYERNITFLSIGAKF